MVGTVVAFSLIGAVAWRFAAKSNDTAQTAKAAQARKSSAAQVQTAVAGPAEVRQSLSLVGTLESPSVVNLSPKQANKILTVSVREGDAVGPGQALVTLDSSTIDAQVLQQRSNVSGAQSRLAQSAVAQGSTATGIEMTINQRLADVQSAQAEYDAARQTQNARLAADKESVVEGEAKVAQAKAGVNSAAANYNSAKASLDNAKAVAARQKRLYDQGYVSLQDLENAQTSVTLQENLLEGARQSQAVAESEVNSAKAQLNAINQTVNVNRKVVEASVTTAKAKLAQAQAAYKAAIANRSQTQAYRESVSALRSDVSSARAQLRGAEAQRNDLVLRSPIEGVVTARTANPGDLGTPGSPILTVQYIKWLFVTVSAPVDQSPNIRVGQFVSLGFDAFPGEHFSARVEKVNPFADPTSRQFTFRVRLENPAQRFRPGMFAKVELATKLVKAKVVVPREAVKDSKVFIVTSEGKVEQREVTTGLTDDSKIEILSGLEPGEKVVTLSYTPLRDGQKVKEGKS